MKKLLSMLLVLAMIMSLAAMSGSAFAEEGEKVLQLCQTMDGSSDRMGNPWNNINAINLVALFRTLLLADYTLQNFSPSLAEDWSISEDGLKWSDGEDLTAADVAYSIKTNLRCATSNGNFTNAFNMIVGAAEYRDGTTEELTGAVVDGNTLTITLTAPYAIFLPVIAQFAILPEHATSDIDPLELHNSEYWLDPVVNGAFRLEEMSVGNYFTLVPNEYYEGTPWKIEKIIVYFVPDQLTAVQAGQVDYINFNAIDTINEVNKLDFMEMHPVDILFYRYFICNMKGVDGNENPAMQDVRVREAIMHAIDRQTLAEQLYPGLATVIHSGVPMDYAEYDGVTFDYDPELAKQLLDEAGYDYSYNFRILTYYTDQATVDFLDTIVYYLGEVGINARVITSTQGTTDLFDTRNYDLGYKGLSAFSIGEWYGEYASTNANFRNIFGGDEQFDANAAAINAESDPAVRSQILTELQTLEEENLYKLPMFTLGNNVFINTDHVKVPEGLVFGNPWYLYDMQLENWEIVG